MPDNYRRLSRAERMAQKAKEEKEKQEQERRLYRRRMLGSTLAMGAGAGGLLGMENARLDKIAPYVRKQNVANKRDKQYNKLFKKFMTDKKAQREKVKDELKTLNDELANLSKGRGYAHPFDEVSDIIRRAAGNKYKLRDYDSIERQMRNDARNLGIPDKARDLGSIKNQINAKRKQKERIGERAKRLKAEAEAGIKPINRRYRLGMMAPAALMLGGMGYGLASMSEHNQ